MTYDETILWGVITLFVIIGLIFLGMVGKTLYGEKIKKWLTNHGL